MIFTHIVAIAKNRVIGANGTLPWHIPEDLKFFRDKTKNHIMIMGRKTFESLPKVLPSRYHIVISRNPTHSEHPDLHYVTSFDFAIAHAKQIIAENPQKWGSEVFIIGGGEIFRQTMSQIDKIYLTKIDKDFDGDSFYPEVEVKDFFLADEQQGGLESNIDPANRLKNPQNLSYSFLTYLKRK